MNRFFAMFTAGAEIGQTMFKVKSFENAGTNITNPTSGGDASADFSGIYFKALVGMSF